MIYRIGKGYVQMDSYGEIHKSHYVLKAVLAALIIAASISTIAALVNKNIETFKECIDILTSLGRCRYPVEIDDIIIIYL